MRGEEGEFGVEISGLGEEKGEGWAGGGGVFGREIRVLMEEGVGAGVGGEED